ncbi:MAG: hypothetical protein GY936_14295 [Ignavibacteriae bacterium]|nr:hypothetical protein [Ignavibacteriota bacterium]
MEYKEAKEIVDGEFTDLEDEEAVMLATFLATSTYGRTDIENARKDGIRWTIKLIEKHGTAKTFSDRVSKELES